MRKFGLIGKSLDHSWSQDYFKEKFLALHLSDCSYENYPLPGLDVIRELVSGDEAIAGLNVTLPYKQEIIRYLDEVEIVAAKTGAVNCIRISRAGKGIFLKGFNTDMPAFRDTLKPLLVSRDKVALVLGTGGAALAVVYALMHLKIEYTLVSRTAGPGVIAYDDVNPKLINGSQIIINATPVGMYPDTDNCPPLPYSCLTGFHLLYDLVYNPAETIFLLKGKENGARTKNGYDMLKLQAELSWDIWNY